ncbi:MAG: hypothetical protein ABI629_12015 [bacterium]
MKYPSLRAAMMALRIFGWVSALFVFAVGVLYLKVLAEVLAQYPLFIHSPILLLLLYGVGFAACILGGLLTLVLNLAVPDVAQLLIDTEGHARRIVAELAGGAAPMNTPEVEGWELGAGTRD